VPLDLSLETHLPEDLVRRLAFSNQKLKEIVTVAKTGGNATTAVIDLSSFTGAPSQKSSLVGSIPPQQFQRSVAYTVRRAQQPQFHPFPTTTIGSFPQTPGIRKARLLYKKGELGELQYRERIAAEIGFAIGAQEALGLDVLVHGEPERSDMVEYFGRLLNGFAFTEHGWVQSYGSRYVRPPIISGTTTYDTRQLVKQSTIHIRASLPCMSFSAHNSLYISSPLPSLWNMSTINSYHMCVCCLYLFYLDLSSIRGCLTHGGHDCP